MAFVKQNGKWLALMAALALVLVAVAGCSGSPAAAATGSNAVTPMITVNGSGDASGAPDIATVQLGINQQGGNLGQVIAAANSTMTKVMDAVKAQGIADTDMQTTNFNVWVEQPTDNNGNPTGQTIYHVQNTLSVKVHDLTKTGDVIGAGLDAGANTVSNLSFGIEDTSALEEQARTKAIADAQNRAQQLADGLGVKLGGPITVTELYGAPPVPRIAFEVPMAAASSAPPVSQGELTVTVDVNVSFAIEK